MASSWCLFFFSSLSVVLGAGIETDFLMDSDPAFQVPEPIKKSDPALKVLWFKALERPEGDMQRLAAEAIARATKFGVPGLTDAIPTLERILESQASHPAVRFAVARALIELQSRSSADKLFAMSKRYGTDLRQLVEPALAKWDFAAARPVWMERLEQKQTQPRDLFLAIRCLQQVRETSAVPSLLKIVNSLEEQPDARLEAASAIGQISNSELETHADRLSSQTRGSRIINRHCAIRLLASSRSDDAQRTLLEMATDTEPSVAAAALVLLNEIEPSLVLPLAANAMASRDQRVREQGVVSYLQRPSVDRLEPLCQLLNDPHPGVRQRVSEGLLQLADQSQFDGPIRRSTTQVLTGDDWRGQEQAALVLASLNHPPVANRLVQLLDSERREVFVTAAWALRKLAVRSTIPAITAKALRLSVARRSQNIPGQEEQIAHLFEACGVMKVKDAVPLLSQFIPHAPPAVERSRSTAIWALGLIHEGSPEDSLIRQFQARIDDNSSMPSESELVKRMCVVSIVRMKAVGQASTMRRHLGKGAIATPFTLAMKWALKELVDEEIPELAPPIAEKGSWFLEPYP